jgi:hypothetical protein
VVDTLVPARDAISAVDIATTMSARGFSMICSIKLTIAVFLTSFSCIIFDCIFVWGDVWSSPVPFIHTRPLQSPLSSWIAYERATINASQAHDLLSST